MLEPIAAIKLLALLGYAILVVVLLKSRVTRSLKVHLGLYLFGLGSWQLTSLLLTLPRSEASAVTWYNLQFAAAGLHGTIFVPLTLVFLGARRLRGAAVTGYVLAAAVVTAGALQLVVHHAVPGEAGYPVPVFGPRVYALSLVLYGFWALGLFFLVRGLRRERVRLQRIRIGYLLAGSVIVLLGTATNFTPLKPYPVDTVCALANALLVAYAVTRYRLVDAGTVLRRGLTLAAVLVAAIGAFILLSLGLDALLRPGQPARVSVTGMLAFTTVLLLAAAMGWRTIRPAIDRLTRRRTVSYDRVLEQFAGSARSLLDAEKLGEMFVRTAAEAVGAERACLLLAEEPHGPFAPAAVLGEWPDGQPGPDPAPSDDFVRALAARKFPLWEQELLVDPRLAELRPACGPFFARTGASVAVPVIREETVVGILCLGDRLSDGLYATEDLRFLSTLAAISASSIEVAHNYREIARQLSIQTFLFALSESLVRSAGAPQGMSAALGVLQGFLRAEACCVIAFAAGGDVLVHSGAPLDPALESELVRVGRALAVRGPGAPGAAPPPGERGGSLDRGSQPAAEAGGTPGAPAAAGPPLRYLPLTSGGEWVGLLALAGPGGDEQGDSQALSGAYRAILSQGLLSMQHVAELRALKEYHEKILASLGTSGEMLFVVDSGGTVLRTNRAASDALGLGPGEAAGRSLRQLLDGGGHGEAGALPAGASADVVRSREMDLLCAGGRRIPVLVSSAVIVGADGPARETVVLARDISQLRDAERRREESERRYRSLFERVLDAVVTFDLDGAIIDMNPAARELLLGAAAQRGPGSRPEGSASLEPLLEPGRFAALKAELAARGSVRDFELPLRTARGARSALFTGGLDESAEPGRAVIQGILRDVTEQRELQRQLLQAQKMESVGTLAGGIAHDFNNILTATLGYALLIRKEIDDREAALSHLQVLEHSARRAVELTRRLLSFSRAGVSDRRPLQLNDIVLEAVQLLRRTFDRSIEILTSCEPGLPPIAGDPGQVHQVLVNLCVNARDAMPHGGTLTLGTRSEPPAGAGGEPAAGPGAGGSVVLEVRDTGTGIPREIVPKIFDPFFTTKGPGEGTGLGLSIVYGIVKQHGGHIDVSSGPGEGTRFTVRFPVSTGGAADPAAAPTPPPQVRGRETVLVVDDEPSIRSLVRISLTELGYTVLEAADGLEAVELYTQHRWEVDIALIDLIMPRLGGREAFLRMRKVNPGLKALFATGHAVEDPGELLATGIQGVIRKPYEMTSVESEIRAVLDRRPG